MGLDIYFSRIRKSKNGKHTDKDEIAYFRKVYFLLPFFKYGDEDCAVTKEQFEELVDTCNEVLENHELAPELLPCSEGFFFGSYEYDKWYFDDVKYVRKTFSDILKNVKPDDEFEMHCWW